MADRRGWGGGAAPLQCILADCFLFLSFRPSLSANRPRTPWRPPRATPPARARATSQDGSPWLVMVYAPWCAHCKALEPTWRQLASALEGEVKVGRVDGSAETLLGKRLGVRAYPSIFFMHEGVFVEYGQGDSRDLARLTKFARGGWKDATPAPWWKVRARARGCESAAAHAGRARVAHAHLLAAAIARRACPRRPDADLVPVCHGGMQSRRPTRPLAAPRQACGTCPARCRGRMRASPRAGGRTTRWWRQPSWRPWRRGSWQSRCWIAASPVGSSCI